MLCALPVIVWLCGPAPRLPGRFACAGAGVVEYPGKVACPSGRRCSTRNAVWCHSHPGFKSQRYRHCRPAPLGPGGLLCLRGVCGGLVAPTDLRPSRGLPARSPSAPRASLGASARSPARPRRPRGGLQSVGVSVCCLAWPRRPWASQPGLPVTSGALHAGGAFVADVAGASARCSARPRRPRAPRPGPPAPPRPSMLVAVGVCTT